MKVKKLLNQFSKHTFFKVLDKRKDLVAVGEVQDFKDSDSKFLEMKVVQAKVNKFKGIKGMENTDYPYLEIYV